MNLENFREAGKDLYHRLHQNMGLPLKPLLAMGLTDSITPGFQYLREIVDSKKDRSLPLSKTL